MKSSKRLRSCLSGKSEFLERLTEVDFDDAWDRQIEADAKAGRLDPLWQEAMEDIKAGRTKPLDEIRGERAWASEFQTTRRLRKLLKKSRSS